MTEAEWLAADDPNVMLSYLERSGSYTHRKMRLFAVACCRRVLHLSPDEEAYNALDAAERYADGLITGATLARRSGEADRLAFQIRDRSAAEAKGARYVVLCAAVAASMPDHMTHYQIARNGVVWLVGSLAGPVAGQRRFAAAKYEAMSQCGLLRDIFGIPTRPAADDPLAPAREGPAVEIARGIYEDRAFDLMPVLGDAIEEAGCTGDALAHCRSGVEHVRGCWVVDALLGRE